MLGRTLMVAMALLMAAGCAAVTHSSSAQGGAALQQQPLIVDDVPAIMRTIKPLGARLHCACA
jgi:hypothetical protein